MKTIKVGKIVEIKKGKKAEKVFHERLFGTTRYIQIKDLRNDDEIEFADEFDMPVVNENDVVIAWDGSNAGTIGFGLNGVIGSTLAKLSLKPEYKEIIKPRYLGWYLKSKYKDINENTTGIAIPHINKKYLTNIEIPLLSLDEQLNIISVLDKIQILSDKKRMAIELLEKLSVSIFSNIFGNFESRKFRSETVTFNDIIVETKYGTAKNLTKDITTGHPILRMNNITYLGRIDTRNIKHARLTQDEKDSLLLKTGDILFNRTNSSYLVGKTAVWNETSEYYYAGYLVRIRIDKAKANPYFISGFLNSDYGKQLLFQKAKPSGNMANFSPSLLRRQKVFLPPIDLQNEYELKVKNIFRKSKLLSDSLIIIDKLNQSILNSFFSQQLKSYESEIDKLLKDDYEQELLINKLRSEEREFETLEEYDTAKSLLFLLLENPKSLAVQNYMTIKKTGKVEIRIKNETSPA